MTDTETLVRDALQHLGVVAAEQPIQAVDMADGIRALNLMMRALEAEGMTFGWSDVDSPSAVLPLPPEAEEAIGYLLAIRLQSRFKLQVDPTIIALATEGKAMLAAQIEANTFRRVEYPDLPPGVGYRLGYSRRDFLIG